MFQEYKIDTAYTHKRVKIVLFAESKKAAERALASAAVFGPDRAGPPGGPQALGLQVKSLNWMLVRFRGPEVLGLQACAQVGKESGLDGGISELEGEALAEVQTTGFGTKDRAEFTDSGQVQSSASAAAVRVNQIVGEGLQLKLQGT
ncbi:MAG: hypothetical protein CSA96_03740, partial [Bacteroidetes bacterium]